MSAAAIDARLTGIEQVSPATRDFPTNLANAVFLGIRHPKRTLAQ